MEDIREHQWNNIFHTFIIPYIFHEGRYMEDKKINVKKYMCSRARLEPWPSKNRVF